MPPAHTPKSRPDSVQLLPASLHSLIEQAAQRTPDATAVLHGATRISFAELERRSRRLAVALRDRGVRRADRVALAIDRSPELLVSMLGVLRAGAAFVSLAGPKPADDLHRTGDERRADLLLVDRRHAERYRGVFERVIVIEDERPRADLPAENDPLPDVEPDAIAFVSPGSAGSQSEHAREFTHRAVVSAIRDEQHRLRFDPRDRLFAVSADASDRTAHYLFGMLAAGGAIVIPDAARVHSAGHWADLLVRERVTVWISRPENMRQLADCVAARSPGVLSALRHVILEGGEGADALSARVRTLAYRARLTHVADAEECCDVEMTAAPAIRPAEIGCASEAGETISETITGEVRPAGAAESDAESFPGDDLESMLIDFWQQALETSPIAVNDNFFNLGGDSMAAAMIFARVERALGKRYLAETFLGAPTIEQLANLIREPAPASANSSAASVVLLQQGVGAAPVFCVACAQGSLWEFRKLARYLGSSFTVYGLAPPGLDGVSDPLDCVAELAKNYLRQIRRTQPAGPYRLLGFSFGGAVAYEIAQQLDAAGERVEVLGLLDAPARGYGAVVRALKSVVMPLVIALTATAKIWRNPHTGRIADPAHSDAFDREYLPGRPRVFAASSRALDRYRARPYRGSALLILAQHRPWLRRMVRDERRSWLRLAQGGCETHLVAASHEDFFSDSHIGPLADKLRSVLLRSPA